MTDARRAALLDLPHSARAEDISERDFEHLPPKERVLARRAAQRAAEERQQLAALADAHSRQASDRQRAVEQRREQYHGAAVARAAALPIHEYNPGKQPGLALPGARYGADDAAGREEAVYQAHSYAREHSEDDEGAEEDRGDEDVAEAAMEADVAEHDEGSAAADDDEDINARQAALAAELQASVLRCDGLRRSIARLKEAHPAGEDHRRAESHADGARDPSRRRNRGSHSSGKHSDTASDDGRAAAEEDVAGVEDEADAAPPEAWQLAADAAAREFAEGLGHALYQAAGPGGASSPQELPAPDGFQGVSMSVGVDVVFGSTPGLTPSRAAGDDAVARDSTREPLAMGGRLQTRCQALRADLSARLGSSVFESCYAVACNEWSGAPVPERHIRVAASPLQDAAVRSKLDELLHLEDALGMHL